MQSKQLKDLQIVEFFITDDIIKYFNLLLDFVSSYPDVFKDTKNSSLDGNCFYTLNLFDHISTKIFYTYTDNLRLLCENNLNTKLNYFYIHMIDYQNGGKMNIHKHNHNEDYSFILYLNSCNDGETVLCVNDTKYTVTPEQNKILLFCSGIPHFAKYSQSKRILVGGFRIK